MRKTTFLVLVAAAFSLLLPACITDPVTGESVFGMPISEQEEIAMGMQAAPSFKAQYEGAYPDEDLQRYCGDIVLRMAKRTHRPDLPWNFTILNSSEVNAFALPGGTVCITRGLLHRLDTEAEFACVMGHELGHVNHKHIAQDIGRRTLLGGILAGAGAWVGRSDSELARLGLSLGAAGGQILLLGYSREQEAEADRSGVEYAVKAGYDPREMPKIFEIFKTLGGGRDTPVWLRSHPLDDDRIRAVKREIRKKYPEILATDGAGLVRDRPEWDMRIARLREAQKVYDVYDRANAEFAKAAKSGDRSRLDGVLAKLKECRARLPTHALFRSGAGVVLYRMGRKDEARREFRQAAAMQDDLFEPHLYLAQLAFERRDTEAVLREARRAEQLYPDHPTPFYLEARSLDRQGELREAAARYREVLKRAPEKSETYRYSARRLREIREAIR